MNVIFHFNVPDKLGYALRLARKVHAGGHRAMIVGADADLDKLNRWLWEQDPNDFVPHVRVPRDGAVAPRLLPTPLWLGEAPPEAGCGLLLNLGDEMPQALERVARVNELVSTDPEDRSRARARWRRYEELGWSIQRHEVPS